MLAGAVMVPGRIRPLAHGGLAVPVLTDVAANRARFCVLNYIPGGREEGFSEVEE